MKHILLITIFIGLGSSLVASEKKNDEVIFKTSQLSLAHLIKENPWSAAGTFFALGSFVPAKTKFHIFIGGAMGAAIVLKATDKNFSDLIDRSFSRFAESFNKTKEAITEKWNDFLYHKN